MPERSRSRRGLSWVAVTISDRKPNWNGRIAVGGKYSLAELSGLVALVAVIAITSLESQALVHKVDGVGLAAAMAALGAIAGYQMHRRG